MSTVIITITRFLCQPGSVFCVQECLKGCQLAVRTPVVNFVLSCLVNWLVGWLVDWLVVTPVGVLKCTTKICNTGDCVPNDTVWFWKTLYLSNTTVQTSYFVV